jgi:hypothetical protein
MSNLTVVAPVTGLTDKIVHSVVIPR